MFSLRTLSLTIYGPAQESCFGIWYIKDKEVKYPSYHFQKLNLAKVLLLLLPPQICCYCMVESSKCT